MPNCSAWRRMARPSMNCSRRGIRWRRAFSGSIETVQGKANRLNQYYAELGIADAFQKDLDRINAVTAADVQRVVRQYLLGPRAILTVVPNGKRELAATPRSSTP